MRTVRFFILGYFILFIHIIPIEADIKRDCRKQSNVSWAALKKLKAGNLSQEDRAVKCYVHCYMKKNGIIDARDGIDVEKVVRLLPKGLQKDSRTALNKCVKLHSSTDHCDRSYRTVACYFKYQPGILKSVSFV